MVKQTITQTRSLQVLKKIFAWIKQKSSYEEFVCMKQTVVWSYNKGIRGIKVGGALQ